jgi:hypothetical protein
VVGAGGTDGTGKYGGRRPRAGLSDPGFPVRVGHVQSNEVPEAHVS